MECKSLKEALDITCEKRNYDKRKMYPVLLKYLMNGDFSVITRDNGARKYAIQYAKSEIDYLYEKISIEKEFVRTGQKVSDKEKISLVSNYFTESNNIKYNDIKSRLNSILFGLSQDDKVNKIHEMIDRNNGMISADELKLFLFRNAYSVNKLFESRSGLNRLLYPDSTDKTIKQDIENTKLWKNYLSGYFYEFNASNIPNYINSLDNETINYLGSLYVTSSNKVMDSYTSMIESINPTKNSIEVFEALKNPELLKSIQNNIPNKKI